MASMFRSHFRPPTSEKTESNKTISRKAVSRIPVKPVAPEISSVPATNPIQRLTKRASRTLKPAEVSALIRATAEQPSTHHDAHTTSGKATLVTVKRKPVAVEPKRTIEQTSSKLTALPQHGLRPAPATRTPSLVSGSSASTFESPRSVGLRRKPSTVDRHAVRSKGVHSGVRSDVGRDDELLDDTVLNISFAPPSTYTHRYDTITPTSVEAPGGMRYSGEFRTSTSAVSQITTPSTRYADSPFSHAPTPSSVSSCSSTIPAPTGIGLTQSPLQQVKPQRAQEKTERRVSRPPLAPVRERSVSSNSTISHRQSLTRRDVSSTAPAVTTKSYAAQTSSSARRRDRSPPVAYNQTPPLQPIVPPELAHLNVDVPYRPSTDRGPRPARPSRDGTTSLDDLSTPAAVVQSDLPRLYTTYSKRGSSLDLQTPLSPSLSSRFGSPSRASSRATDASSRIDSAISPPPTARKIGGTDAVTRPRKAEAPSRERRVLRKGSPAIPAASSPSPLKQTSRFGLFSRKSRPEENKDIGAGKISSKPKRTPSKGPAAGTGHEGYGRFGARPRAGSVQSIPDSMSSAIDSRASPSTQTTMRPSSKRKSSFASSTASEPELDDFLRARLTPVVLRGSNASSSRGSEVSNLLSTSNPRQSTITDSSATSSIDSYPVRQLLPSAMQSQNVSSSSIDRAPPRPTRMSTEEESKSGNQDQSQRHADLTDDTLSRYDRLVQGGEGLWLRPQQLPPPAQPAYKWNFMQRAAQLRPLHDSDEHSRLHAGINQPYMRNNAHYALIDSVESVALDEVAQVLRDDSHQLHAYSQNTSLDLPRENLTPAMATPSTFHEDVQSSPQRPSRLSPIGRIPRVVSKRDRDRKLSDNSFSRPFAKHQPQPAVKPPGALYSSIRELASPVDDRSQPNSGNSHASSDLKQNSSVLPSSAPSSRTSTGIVNAAEFFALPPRKDSDMSYNSSHQSWLAALAAQPPQQDDPWTEYNDLIDDMLPQWEPASATSSNGVPFQYMHLLPGYNPSLPAALALRTPPPSSNLPMLPGLTSVPYVLSVPQQIARFMQPSLSPLAPSAAEPWTGGHRASAASTLDSRISSSWMLPSGEDQGFRSSLVNANEVNLRHSRGSRGSRGSLHSRSASLPEANVRDSQSSVTGAPRFKHDVQLNDIAEDDSHNKVCAAGLRFGALMTSKWLSFGRVLFSPAHNEVALGQDPRILIVDGLGSDWSYYVALSYPSATVYNLGPARGKEATALPGEAPAPPANHRHIPHQGMQAAFPFPRGFFTAVVFRFPLATAEEAYHACIFECKRVLRPGGFLEVAVLDLDLMNMGQRARRAVRNLKISMQQQDCRVDLSNLSDVLLRLIGRRGFEEVQRCIVGIPAAGRIPGSHDNSQVDTEDGGHAQREFDFSGLMQQTRPRSFEPGAENDESITKMVAHVGRWWYSTCYEGPVLQNGGRSIWADNALLRECEKQGTSFRLLICHAQKPIQTRRRTVSV